MLICYFSLSKNNNNDPIDNAVEIHKYIWGWKSSAHLSLEIDKPNCNTHHGMMWEFGDGWTNSH